MLKKGFNESRMIAFFNKKNRKRLLYVAVVKETTMLDLKLSLLNHFIKSFRNSISGFRLVRKGPPEDDDNDTISDNYFDDKFNDEKVFDFLNLIESKQLYEKRKDGTFFIYFRAIKLTLNITIIQSGDTQNFTFPLSLKDNTITKFIHDIEEKIQEPLNEPYHIFQNNQNLDKISEEDDMKQYSESGLIMFLFPIQVDFIDKSTQKKAKILFKSNEPLSIYLPKIFELLSIQKDPSDYYFENDEEKIDIELPIINFLRKKQRKNEFVIEINKNDFDLKYYDIISKIGEGSFSNVYKIKNTKTNQYFAAKITKFMIDEDTEKSEQTCFLYREVNLMSSFNHPSILKFIGYNPLNFKNESFPTLITEFASNGSLRNLIELENSGLSLNGWDITKKLIIIYGIASGISYLHKHNVLHRDLKTTNILIDEYLHPKIADFGLSKLTDFLSISMNMQSKKGLKGTVAYLSPEILNNEEEYSKKGDVYAFAFIVFELMTGDVPYNDLNSFKLMDLVNQGFRPNIRDDVPDSYRELIENCWSQDPNDRPSFDDIVEILKENEGFITDTTDEAEFFDYVDFIDNYQSTFDTSKHVIHFSEFIENHGRNKNVKMFNINEIE